MQSTADKTKELRECVKKLHDDHMRVQENLANVSNARAQAGKSHDKKKLRNLYKIAIQDANNEVSLICKTLNCIKDLQDLHYKKPLHSKHLDGSTEIMDKRVLVDIVKQRGMTLPLWVGRASDTPPPMCGAIPAQPQHIAKIGDLVAAYVEINKKGTWILAEVADYNSSTNTYEIDDIDKEQHEKYFVDRSTSIIPLPLCRPNPQSHPEALFMKGTRVLGLYPRTTCFYPAMVKQPPAKLHDDYELLFEDAESEEKYCEPYFVCQQYVIAYRDC